LVDTLVYNYMDRSLRIYIMSLMSFIVLFLVLSAKARSSHRTNHTRFQDWTQSILLGLSYSVLALGRLDEFHDSGRFYTAVKRVGFQAEPESIAIGGDSGDRYVTYVSYTTIHPVHCISRICSTSINIPNEHITSAS